MSEMNTDNSQPSDRINLTDFNDVFPVHGSPSVFMDRRLDIVVAKDPDEFHLIVGKANLGKDDPRFVINISNKANHWPQVKYIRRLAFAVDPDRKTTRDFAASFDSSVHGETMNSLVVERRCNSESVCEYFLRAHYRVDHRYSDLKQLADMLFDLARWFEGGQLRAGTSTGAYVEVDVDRASQAYRRPKIEIPPDQYVDDFVYSMTGNQGQIHEYGSLDAALEQRRNLGWRCGIRKIKVTSTLASPPLSY